MLEPIMLTSIFDMPIAKTLRKDDGTEFKALWLRDSPNYMIQEFGGQIEPVSGSFRSNLSLGLYIRTQHPPTLENKDVIWDDELNRKYMVIGTPDEQIGVTRVKLQWQE